MSKTTENNKIEVDSDELRTIVREEIAQFIQSVSDDPDAGLEIKDEAVEEIRESQKQIEEGKTLSREEVQEKYMN